METEFIICCFRATSSSSARSVPGSEYKSKKAKGDVKRKGKLDPYAYLPLQRSGLNKRYIFTYNVLENFNWFYFVQEKDEKCKTV